MSDSPLIITFRDTLRAYSPPWLQNGLAEKILYSIGVMLDAGGDALIAGIKIRFPMLYSPESLALIGRERRIRRGRTETDDGYGLRLLRWWDDHPRRGGPYALLEQLYAHYAPNNFTIQLVYRSGTRFTMDPAGNITQTIVTVGNFENWAQWALLYETDVFDISDVEDIAVVPREWIAAHCFGEVIVLPTGSELWDYPTTMQWNQTGVWDVTPDITIRVPIVMPPP